MIDVAKQGSAAASTSQASFWENTEKDLFLCDVTRPFVLYILSANSTLLTGFISKEIHEIRRKQGKNENILCRYTSLP